MLDYLSVTKLVEKIYFAYFNMFGIYRIFYLLESRNGNVYTFKNCMKCIHD